MADRSLARNSLDLSLLVEVVQCFCMVPSGLDKAWASTPDFLQSREKIAANNCSEKCRSKSRQEDS